MKDLRQQSNTVSQALLHELATMAEYGYSSGSEVYTIPLQALAFGANCVGRSLREVSYAALANNVIVLGVAPTSRTTVLGHVVRLVGDVYFNMC